MRIQGAILDELHQGFVRENTALASAYPWMAQLTRMSTQAAERGAQLTRDRTNATIRGAPIEEQAFYDAAAMMGIGLNARAPAATGGGRFAALFEQPPTAVTRNVPGPAVQAVPAAPAGTGNDPNRPGASAGDSPSPGVGGAPGTDDSNPGTDATPGHPGDPGDPGGLGGGDPGDPGGDPGDFKTFGAPRSAPRATARNVPQAPAATPPMATDAAGSGPGVMRYSDIGGEPLAGPRGDGLPLQRMATPPMATDAASLVAQARAAVNAGWTDQQILRRGTELGLGNPFAQQQTLNAIRAGWTDAQTIQAGQRMGLSLSNPLGQSTQPVITPTPVVAPPPVVNPPVNPPAPPGRGTGGAGAITTGARPFTQADVDRVVQDVLARTGGQFQITPFGLSRAQAAVAGFLQQGMSPEQASNALLQFGMSGNLPATFGTGRVTNPGPSGLVPGRALPTTGVSTQPAGPGPTPAVLADLIVQDAITRSGLLPTQEGYVQMLRQVDRMVGLGASREQISDTLIANARTPGAAHLIASRAPTPGGTTLSPYERAFPALSEGFATSTLGGETLDPLSGAEMGRIGTVYNTASRRADEDVLRFSDEIAGARGLRQTDTPIGAVTLRERSRLAENIRGAQANTELTMGAQQRAFRESVRQFQEGLRQTAFSNRMQLSGRSAAAPAPPATAPSFTPGGGVNAANAASNAVASRGANRGTTTTTSEDQTGNLLGAAASIAGALITRFSTARVKKGIEPYDRDEYERALQKLCDTPVTRWRYVWEPDDARKHTGPILELSPEDIKADDTRLDLLSYVGMTHAAVKGLDRKVDRLAEAFLASAEAA